LRGTPRWRYGVQMLAGAVQSTIPQIDASHCLVQAGGQLGLLHLEVPEVPQDLLVVALAVQLSQGRLMRPNIRSV